DRGELTGAWRGKDLLLKRELNPEGLLQSVTDGTTWVESEYRKDGMVSSLLLRADPAAGAAPDWVRLDLDERGGMRGFFDSSGASLEIFYDGEGRVQRVMDGSGGEMSLERDGED